MKKMFVTTIIILYIAIECNAQQPMPLHYRFRSDTYVQECDIEGNTSGFEAKLAPMGSKFTIVRVEDEYYIIRFWVWNRKDFTPAIETKVQARASLTKKEAAIAERATLRQSLNFNESDPVDNVRFFRIPKPAFDVYAEEIKSALSPTFGAAVLPFKYRFSDNDFTKDVSLSNMGGVRWNFKSPKDLSLSFLIGIGVGSVTLDSMNTDGTVRNSEDRAAITLPVGVVWQWEKLQIGVFTGWDWLTKSQVDNWRNQGKQWFALGIGFAIFAEETTKRNEGTNK